MAKKDLGTLELDLSEFNTRAAAPSAQHDPDAAPKTLRNGDWLKPAPGSTAHVGFEKKV